MVDTGVPEETVKEGSLDEGVGETAVAAGASSGFPWIQIAVGGVVVLTMAGLVFFYANSRQGKSSPESSEYPTSVPASAPTTQTPESSPTELYPCHSTTSTPVESVSDFDVVDLFAVRTHPDGYDYDRLDNPPTISLSAFKEASRPTHDVYYEVTKDTRLYTGFWGVALEIEVCDQNNQTNIPLKEPAEANIISQDEPAASAARYVHGGYAPAQPGTYRVDAYLLRDGEWILTNRLEDLVFTE